MKRLLFSVMISMGLLAFSLAETPTALAQGKLPVDTGYHVQWNKTPISFPVKIGTERLISFPGRVSLTNTNPQLSTDKVSILNNDGTLYIDAKKTFSPIRVQVRLLSSGDVALIDISGVTSADSAPITVVMKKKDHATLPSMTDGKDNTANPITLTRFAIQQLYAPTRLLKQPVTITRAPMHTTKTVRLFYGGNVLSYPLISWQSGNETVTAILVKNVSRYTQVLDPRRIIGDWQTLSFYPTNRLAAVGRHDDSTTAFLISRRAFGVALSGNKGYRT